MILYFVRSNVGRTTLNFWNEVEEAEEKAAKLQPENGSTGKWTERKASANRDRNAGAWKRNGNVQ
jgi:hypothetical protein